MDYADNEDLGGLAYPYPDPAIISKNYATGRFRPDPQPRDLRRDGTAVWQRIEPWLKSGPGSWILGGWLINPVISGMSGFPFTVSAGGSLNANGSGQTADLIKPFKKLGGKPPRTGATCGVGDPSCSYFDPSSFAAPLIYQQCRTAHYGNTKRNEFRGPGFFNMNLSIVRTSRSGSLPRCRYEAMQSASPTRPISTIPALPAQPVQTRADQVVQHR